MIEKFCNKLFFIYLGTCTTKKAPVEVYLFVHVPKVYTCVSVHGKGCINMLPSMRQRGTKVADDKSAHEQQDTEGIEAAWGRRRKCSR